MRKFLWNVSSHLKTGGYFAATTFNRKELLKLLPYKHKDGTEAIYNVRNGLLNIPSIQQGNTTISYTKTDEHQLIAKYTGLGKNNGNTLWNIKIFTDLIDGEIVDGDTYGFPVSVLFETFSSAHKEYPMLLEGDKFKQFKDLANEYGLVLMSEYPKSFDPPPKLTRAETIFSQLNSSLLFKKERDVDYDELIKKAPLKTKPTNLGTVGRGRGSGRGRGRGRGQGRGRGGRVVESRDGPPGTARIGGRGIIALKLKLKVRGK